MKSYDHLMAKIGNKKPGFITNIADVSQNLKDIMRNEKHWDGLSSQEKEVLEAIQYMISRILAGESGRSGSWNWVAIAGYALVINEIVESDECEISECEAKT